MLCGVEFMGESAKLLNPTKTVLLPEPGADCPMAHMVKRETVDAARAEYGDDLAVVCYVNSTVEIKSWSDARTCRSTISCSFPTRTWAAS